MENLNFTRRENIIEKGPENSKYFEQPSKSVKLQKQLEENLKMLISKFNDTESSWNDKVKERFYQEFRLQLISIVKNLCQELDNIDNKIVQTKKEIDNLS